mgnify:CR=1 FL=1
MIWPMAKGVFHSTLVAFAVVAILRVAGLGVSWAWGLFPAVVTAGFLFIFLACYLATYIYFKERELQFKKDEQSKDGKEG